MSEPRFAEQKAIQAVLLFVHTLNNGLLGKTKLFKLLYYADFDHFEKYGQPITGETYLRYDHGPFPQHGNNVLDGMITQEKLAVQPVVIGDFLQYRYLPRETPNLNVFSPEEVKTLFEVVAKWEKHNAREMVAATHGEAPWIATEPNKAIRYSLAYYRNKFSEMDQFDDEIRDATPIEQTG